MKNFAELRVGDKLWRTHNLTDWTRPESATITEIKRERGGGDSNTDWWIFTLDYFDLRDEQTTLPIRGFALKGSSSGGVCPWYTSEERAFKSMIDWYEENISKEYQEISEHLSRIEGLQETYNKIKENYGSKDLVEQVSV